MNYSKDKIYAEAGLAKSGEEYIGTKLQWEHAEHTERMLDEHDHKESGCECEQYLNI